jgi:hypothetical protein
VTRFSGDIKLNVEQSIDTFCTQLSNLVQSGVNNMEANLKQYETHMTVKVKQSEALVDKATDIQLYRKYVRYQTMQ